MFYSNQRKCSLTAILLSLHLCSNVYAADETSNFFDLSMQELMDINVSVASIKAENISSTPAVVSTYPMQIFMQQGILFYPVKASHFLKYLSRLELRAEFALILKVVSRCLT